VKGVGVRLRHHFDRATSWSGRGLIILLASGAVLLVVLPLSALGWRSYQEQAWTLVSQDSVRQAVRLSFSTTLISLGIILMLGTPLAYILARWSFRGKKLVSVLIQLPIVLPPAVAGLALLITFGRRGLLGPALQAWDIRIVFTEKAVILAQVFVAMPFYVRAGQAGFRGVSREVEEAALVDGATSWGQFLYVTFPLSRKALVSGALLSWARALGEFGATILFAGSLQGRTQTMPLLIYSAFEQNVDAAIWTALILVGLAFLVLVSVLILSRENDAEL
jgi:molybdate transport system permease protein